MTASLDMPNTAEIIAACRERTERLRVGLRERGFGCCVVHTPEAVQYLTGARTAHGWPVLGVITQVNVRVAYFGGPEEQPVAGTEQRMLWPMRGDRHTDEALLLCDIAGEFVRAAVGEAENGVIAVEQATLPVWLADVIAGVAATRREDGSHLLRAMRRSKDAVEQRSIRANVLIAEAGYMAAKEVVAPGRTELDVYQAMREACDLAAGTSVPLGGDFAAGPGGGVRGGPPSTRALVGGESYVIDFWPSLGGYWADLCRTYPIGPPTGPLVRAVGALCDALDEAERLIAPGVMARDVDQAVRAVLARHQEFAQSAHLHISGHGIGLEAHESPWLVSHSDDVLVAGDVIAVEPGLYSEDLRGGARVEDDYLVTTNGCERLSMLDREW